MTELDRSKLHMCPADEIADYLDGELDAARDRELELHFAECGTCEDELRLQRQFLCALNSSLDRQSEIDLPEDFTRRVVANAESSVSGLRKPVERFNAIFICTALLLFVLFALGVDASGLFTSLGNSFDQVAVIGSFFGHVVYSVVVGVWVILRSVGGVVQIPAAVSLLLVAVVLYVFTRAFYRFRRA
jgi:anti-sigma factor RsiW